MQAMKTTAAAFGSLAILLQLTGCGSSRNAWRNPFGSGSSQVASSSVHSREDVQYFEPASHPNQNPLPGQYTDQQQPFGSELTTEYLLQLGAQLADQGQHEQAAEIFQGILQREPNNAIARQELARLNGGATQPAPMPPSPATPTFPTVQPKKPAPPAPPAGEKEVPVIRNQARKAPAVSEPSNNANVESSQTEYSNSSNRALTTVTPRSLTESPHTIRIIPALKGGVRKVTEFHYGRNDQVKRAVKRDEEQPLKSPLKFDRSALPPADGGSTKKKASPKRSKPYTPPKVPREIPRHLQGDTETVKLSKLLAKKHPELVQLATWSRRPEKHVGVISAHLTNRAPAVRSLSAWLLGKASGDAADMIPALERQLVAEQNGPTRVRVAEALLRITPGHAASVRVIGDALNASERVTRWEAMCVVDILSDHDNRDTIVASLIQRLEDVDEKIRVMAALKLGEFRQDHDAILPALQPLASRKQPSKLREAARAATKVLELQCRR